MALTNVVLPSVVTTVEFKLMILGISAMLPLPSVVTTVEFK